MDELNIRHLASRLHSTDERPHFQRIGVTLAVCEASTLRVGIPFLPPTRRIWELRSHMEGTLEYFLRLNLLEIPTSILQSYHEELFSGSGLSECLSIPPVSRFERGYSVVLIFLGALLLSLLSSAVFDLAPGSAGLSAVVSSGAGWLLGASLVSDEHRRLSFAWTLYCEILRRQGVDPSGGGNLQVCVPG